MHIAFIRGLNVGGSGMVSMPELTRIATESGLSNVRTYLRSGNLIGTPVSANPTTTANLLASALTLSGHPARVFVRTVDELAAVVADCPFLDRTADPTRVHVAFRDEPAATGFDAATFAPEEAVDAGRHTYLWLPAGMGRSKLGAALARRDGDRHTVRNWRTVTAVLAAAATGR